MEGDSQSSRIAFRRFESAFYSHVCFYMCMFCLLMLTFLLLIVCHRHHFSQHFSQLCPLIRWNFQRATRVAWDSLKDLCGGANSTARTDSARSAFTLFRLAISPFDAVWAFISLFLFLITDLFFLFSQGWLLWALLGAFSSNTEHQHRNILKFVNWSSLLRFVYSFTYIFQLSATTNLKANEVSGLYN